MPDMAPESALHRLRWLVSGKPTASEFEDLGGTFNPQFHFMALLPAPALPTNEAEKAQRYFDAMFDALAPVRHLIGSYWLRGVMSRTPVSDFSLEVQFLDPDIVGMVRNSLPREQSVSAMTLQQRYENTLATPAEANMFFRDKGQQGNPNQSSNDLSRAQVPRPTPDSAPPGPPRPVVAIPTLVPAAVLPQPVYTPPIAPPIAREPKLKKMVVAEGVTIQGCDILGCAHLAIQGEAFSTIDRCEKLEILEGGIFKGSASVVEAEISGYCTGTLVVRGTLRITRTGRVVGSIQYGRLQVEDGGRIEGEMKMPSKSNEAEPQIEAEISRWLDVNTKIRSQSVA